MSTVTAAAPSSTAFTRTGWALVVGVMLVLAGGVFAMLFVWILPAVDKPASTSEVVADAWGSVTVLHELRSRWEPTGRLRGGERVPLRCVSNGRWAADDPALRWEYTTVSNPTALDVDQVWSSMQFTALTASKTRQTGWWTVPTGLYTDSLRWRVVSSPTVPNGTSVLRAASAPHTVVPDVRVAGAGQTADVLEAGAEACWALSGLSTDASVSLETRLPTSKTWQTQGAATYYAQEQKLRWTPSDAVAQKQWQVRLRVTQPAAPLTQLTLPHWVWIRDAPTTVAPGGTAADEFSIDRIEIVDASTGTLGTFGFGSTVRCRYVRSDLGVFAAGALPAVEWSPTNDFVATTTVRSLQVSAPAVRTAQDAACVICTLPWASQIAATVGQRLYVRLVDDVSGAISPVTSIEVQYQVALSPDVVTPTNWIYFTNLVDTSIAYASVNLYEVVLYVHVDAVNLDVTWYDTANWRLDLLDVAGNVQYRDVGAPDVGFGYLSFVRTEVSSGKTFGLVFHGQRLLPAMVAGNTVAFTPRATFTLDEDTQYQVLGPAMQLRPYTTADAGVALVQPVLTSVKAQLNGETPIQSWSVPVDPTVWEVPAANSTLVVDWWGTDLLQPSWLNWRVQLYFSRDDGSGGYMDFVDHRFTVQEPTHFQVELTVYEGTLATRTFDSIVYVRVYNSRNATQFLNSPTFRVRPRFTATNVTGPAAPSADGALSAVLGNTDINVRLVGAYRPEWRYELLYRTSDALAVVAPWPTNQMAGSGPATVSDGTRTWTSASIRFTTAMFSIATRYTFCWMVTDPSNATLSPVYSPWSTVSVLPDNVQPIAQRLPWIQTTYANLSAGETLVFPPNVTVTLDVSGLAGLLSAGQRWSVLFRCETYSDNKWQVLTSDADPLETQTGLNFTNVAPGSVGALQVTMPSVGGSALGRAEVMLVHPVTSAGYLSQAFRYGTGGYVDRSQMVEYVKNTRGVEYPFQLPAALWDWFAVQNFLQQPNGPTFGLWYMYTTLRKVPGAFGDADLWPLLRNGNELRVRRRSAGVVSTLCKVRTNQDNKVLEVVRSDGTPFEGTPPYTVAFSVATSFLGAAATESVLVIVVVFRTDVTRGSLDGLPQPQPDQVQTSLDDYSFEYVPLDSTLLRSETPWGKLQNPTVELPGNFARYYAKAPNLFNVRPPWLTLDRPYVWEGEGVPPCEFLNEGNLILGGKALQVQGGHLFYKATNAQLTGKTLGEMLNTQTYSYPTALTYTLTIGDDLLTTRTDSTPSTTMVPGPVVVAVQVVPEGTDEYSLAYTAGTAGRLRYLYFDGGATAKCKQVYNSLAEVPLKSYDDLLLHNSLVPTMYPPSMRVVTTMSPKVATTLQVRDGNGLYLQVNSANQPATATQLGVWWVANPSTKHQWYYDESTQAIYWVVPNSGALSEFTLAAEIASLGGALVVRKATATAPAWKWDIMPNGSLSPSDIKSNVFGSSNARTYAGFWVLKKSANYPVMPTDSGAHLQLRMLPLYAATTAISAADTRTVACSARNVDFFDQTTLLQGSTWMGTSLPLLFNHLGVCVFGQNVYDGAPLVMDQSGFLFDNQIDNPTDWSVLGCNLWYYGGDKTIRLASDPRFAWTLKADDWYNGDNSRLVISVNRAKAFDVYDGKIIIQGTGLAFHIDGANNVLAYDVNAAARVYTPLNFEPVTSVKLHKWWPDPFRYGYDKWFWTGVATAGTSGTSRVAQRETAVARLPDALDGGDAQGQVMAWTTQAATEQTKAAVCFWVHTAGAADGDRLAWWFTDGRIVTWPAPGLTPHRTDPLRHWHIANGLHYLTLASGTVLHGLYDVHSEEFVVHAVPVEAEGDTRLLFTPECAVVQTDAGLWTHSAVAGLAQRWDYTVDASQPWWAHTSTDGRTLYLGDVQRGYVWQKRTVGRAQWRLAATWTWSTAPVAHSVDATGRRWAVATASGVEIWTRLLTRGVQQHFALTASWPVSQPVQSLAFDSHGDLWLVDALGVSRWAGDVHQQYEARVRQQQLRAQRVSPPVATDADLAQEATLRDAARAAAEALHAERAFPAADATGRTPRVFASVDVNKVLIAYGADGPWTWSE